MHQAQSGVGWATFGAHWYSAGKMAVADIATSPVLHDRRADDLDMQALSGWYLTLGSKGTEGMQSPRKVGLDFLGLPGPGNTRSGMCYALRALISGSRSWHLQR